MQTFFKSSLFVILFGFTVISVAQKKLLRGLDSTIVEQNHYLARYDLNSFRASGLSEEKIDPENIDLELAAAAIFFKLNEWRTKKRKAAFREHSQLEKVAHSYTNYYKRYRFKKTVQNQYRLTRTLNRVPKYLILDFAFLEGFVLLSPIIDYERGNYYYNEELGSSEHDFYFGNFSNDDDFEEKPIESITYSEFAQRALDQMIRSRFGTMLRSKGYELASVSIAKVNSKYRKRYIPAVKVTCLIGAYRNMYFNDEDEQ